MFDSVTLMSEGSIVYHGESPPILAFLVLLASPLCAARISSRLVPCIPFAPTYTV